MSYNSFYRLADVMSKLHSAGFAPLDVLVTGATGAGKSTTLNALFRKEIAEIGDGVDPQTMDLESYSYHSYLRFWDTPGLGDSIDQDKLHSNKIIDLLGKMQGQESNKYYWIDLVLVILDGGTRELGTTYKLLNEVILPHFPAERILVAINQADFAMKGHHWNKTACVPEEPLIEFLNEKRDSIVRRVKEATNLNIPMPIYYSAQYHYNIEKLYDFIIDHIPNSRRVIDMKSAYQRCLKKL